MHARMNVGKPVWKNKEYGKRCWLASTSAEMQSYNGMHVGRGYSEVKHIS